MEQIVLNQIFTKNTEMYSCSQEFKNTFKCEACSNRFAFKSTLEYHLKREIGKLTMSCKQCKELLYFKNRCTMLLHMKLHNDNKDHGYTLKDFSIEPIAYKRKYKRRNDVLHDYSVTVPMDVHHEGNAEESNSGDEEIPNGSCPFCKFKYKGTTRKTLSVSRMQHFQRMDDSESFDHTCNHCTRILPNDCSLSAHKCIHTEGSPYLCPDCGEIFSNATRRKQHLAYTCFHYFRMMYVNCVIEGCDQAFREQNIHNHFKKHLKLVHNCPECETSFQKFDGLKSHVRSAHDNTLQRPNPTIICLVCNVVVSKRELFFHVVDHFKKVTKVRSVFECPGCKHYVMRPPLMSHHVNKCEPYKKLIRSGECHKFPSLLERAKSIGGKKKLTPVQKKPQTPTKVDNLDEPTLSKDATSSESEIDALNVSVGPEEVSGAEVEPEPEPEQEQEQEQSVSRPTVDSPVDISPPEKIRRTMIKDLRQIDKKKIVSYSCGACTYKTVQNKRFLDHILLHRDDGTAYQCLECGLCFSTKATFIDHLQVKHPTEISDKYIERKKDCFVRDESLIEKSNVYPASTAELDEVKEEDEDEYEDEDEELECPECGEIFYNSIELDKHFRSHGMAFLMQKKR